MSYIGKTPTVGNFIKLDAITASATASYTMQHGGVNFQPESALHMLVSLNGVIQSPNTSFTISGSTITFSSALTSSDSIDFIIVYGNVLDIGTPSDGTVTDAKANFVSTSSAAGLQIKGDGTTDGTLQLNCSQNSHGIKLKSPAHSSAQSYTLTFPTTSPSANKFLKTDGSGNLSFADAGANTPLFKVRLSNNQTITTTTRTVVAFDSVSFDTGSNWDNTNKRYIPDEAGYYLFFSQVRLADSADFSDYGLRIRKNANTTTDSVESNISSFHFESNFSHVIFYMNGTSDYADVTAYHNKGSDSTISAPYYSWFQGFKLIGS